MIQLSLEENVSKPFETATKTEMDKAVRHFEKDLTTVRTGKAHPSLVEDIRAEVYGSSMSLREVASIAAPDTNMITIQPWDKSIVANIEKAIMTSHLGITPQTDGDLIRIELPRMSNERRDELAKLVNKKIEDAKVAIRNVRKDFVNLIRDGEKKKDISEDFAKRLSKILQDITDSYINMIDTTGDKKKADLKSF